GSNRRPLPCHGSALPAAPQAHVFDFNYLGRMESTTPAKSYQSWRPCASVGILAPFKLGYKFRTWTTRIAKVRMKFFTSVVIVKKQQPRLNGASHGWSERCHRLVSLQPESRFRSN